MPGSEDDLVAGAPLHSPEWSEERFRVDRKKLEAMLQGRHPPCVLGLPGRAPDSFPNILVPRPSARPKVDLVPRPFPRGAEGHPGSGDLAGVPTLPRLPGLQAPGTLC